MRKIKLLLIVTIISLVSSLTHKLAPENFLKARSPNDPITVHIVPHTHDDAGWNWTFRDYFYGTASMDLGVKDILTSMVESLSENKDRTFIEVEIAFFEKWWIDQTDTTKAKVKKFLQEGRLEFINGGYVMHDEATSYYQHFIDQTRLGMMFLKKEFDYIPRIAWFIDPFGHSAANAAILSHMGFEKIVFVRIDYKEKQIRQKNKTLEFQWKPFSQVAAYANTEIFSHITYAHYCPPGSMDGFINDNVVQLSDKDWQDRADRFYNEIHEWNSGFITNNVMLMYGCDFTHRVKFNNFLNVEKLMQVMAERHPDMKLIYSTPSKYFDTVLSQNKDWSVYNNQDFFPYADNEYSYWTGYFTSRPYLKGMVREAGNYLANSSKFLFEFLLNLKRQKVDPPTIETKLFYPLAYLHEMRQNLAICQHHDAVSGTAKEVVSENYIEMLNDGIDNSKKVFKYVVNQYLGSQGISNQFVQVCINPITNFYCDKMFSEVNEKKRQKFLIYRNGNTTGQLEIEIRLNDSNYKILDSTEKEIQSDIVCDIIEHNQKLCQAYFNVDETTLVFYVQEVSERRELQGLNLSELYKSNGQKHGKLMIYEDESISISNVANDNTLSFHVKEKVGPTPIKSQDYTIKISHGIYTSYDGNNSDLRPKNSNPDGAYILSTTKLEPDLQTVDFSLSTLLKGKNIIQISFKFPNSVMHIRYSRLKQYFLEVESVYDPIGHPSGDSEGKELILHFKTDLDNNIKFNNSFSTPEFWTDANGVKMMRRYKDYRSGWNYTITEKVASNFYPVNYAISLREGIKNILR